MAFTSHADLFVSVNEAGINQIVRHIMRQRPSLFNYGTAGVVRNPKLLCAPINPAPAVLQRGNPLVSIEPPLPIIGTHPQLGLDFAVQLTELQVDFSPGNAITLPAELNPPLATQHFALHFQACAGLGCPSDRLIAELQHGLSQANRSIVATDLLQREKPGNVIVLHASELDCFCLDLYAIGDVNVSGTAGHQRLFPHLDGLDIVEIKPDGLENSLLCYLKLMLQLGVLAGGFAIPDLTFNLTNLSPVSVGLTPTSAVMPFNPAIEDDQLKLFINVDTVVPPPTILPCPVPGGGGGGGGGTGPTRSIGWGAGPATGPGPDHLTVAVSAHLIQTMFAVVRNSFHPCFSGSKNLGPFTARFAAGGHLENGTVTLANDDSISVTGLALKWDTLVLDLDVDIPQICVGGFCIIPNIFTGGCAVRAPEICAFSANPDFTIPLDLSGLVTSSLTVTIRPLIKYGIETTHPSTMTDLDAEDLGIPNEWGVFLDPLFLHIEFVNFPDFVANLLTAAVDAAVDSVLGFLPGWAKDLIKSILGGAISIIRTVLGIPGDIVDWLSNLLGVDLNLFDLVTTALAQHFAKDSPLLQLEDPYPILQAQVTPIALIPVKIPIRDLAVRVTADEMILSAKVGA